MLVECRVTPDSHSHLSQILVFRILSFCLLALPVPSSFYVLSPFLSVSFHHLLCQVTLGKHSRSPDSFAIHFDALFLTSYILKYFTFSIFSFLFLPTLTSDHLSPHRLRKVLVDFGAGGKICRVDLNFVRFRRQSKYIGDTIFRWPGNCKRSISRF